MQINLVEKKNSQPRAGYNYDPPICDLSILQVLIDFDTPFCSVKIFSEYNTLSASRSNSSCWDVQTFKCLAGSAWGLLLPPRQKGRWSFFWKSCINYEVLRKRNAFGVPIRAVKYGKITFQTQSWPLQTHRRQAFVFIPAFSLQQWKNNS